MVANIGMLTFHLDLVVEARNWVVDWMQLQMPVDGAEGAAQGSGAGCCPESNNPGARLLVVGCCKSLVHVRLACMGLNL